MAFITNDFGPAPTDPRGAARSEAFDLIEAVQDGDGQAAGAIERLLEHAATHVWPEIVRLALHASAVRALIDRDPQLPAIIERLFASAEADADVVMMALALTWRAFPAVTGGDPARSPQADADLARASVLLESAPATREAAAAHVACAIGYTDRRLWELADEHHACAQRTFTTDPKLHGLLAYNRAETQLRWACAMSEVGDREGLETHCRAGLAAAVAARHMAIPTGWRRDTEVMGLVLDAITGRDVRAAAEAMLVDPGTSPEFVGHVHLALALVHRRRGDIAAAAAECLAATELIDGTDHASEHDLALRIAVDLEGAGPQRPTAGIRYAERQAKLRWGARLSALGTMRARLDAERRSTEYEALTRQAQLDPLTSLANRRGLERYLNTLRAQQLHSVAVLVADIDRFKMINDTYGHGTGDTVLNVVAEVLRAHVRAGDLVARLGGDEFLIVLADADKGVARRRSDAIHTAFADTDWHDLDPQVTVSMGLAVGAPVDIDTLIARADTALYRAKTSGRSRTVSC